MNIVSKYNSKQTKLIIGGGYNLSSLNIYIFQMKCVKSVPPEIIIQNEKKGERERERERERGKKSNIIIRYPVDIIVLHSHSCITCIFILNLLSLCMLWHSICSRDKINHGLDFRHGKSYP
jgi:hypothetical protein